MGGGSLELVSTVGRHRDQIGSGGTLLAIAAMSAASRGETYGSLHGYKLLHADVVHLLTMLSRSTLAERRNIPGLNPDRADIIVAGVAVVEMLLDFCHGNLLRINERGIREGLILRALQRNGCGADDRKRRARREGVFDFAASCHYDAEHSLQVTRLAGRIFSAIAEASSIPTISYAMRTCSGSPLGSGN